LITRTVVVKAVHQVADIRYRLGVRRPKGFKTRTNKRTDNMIVRPQKFKP
jgi:hypothetical protein